MKTLDFLKKKQQADYDNSIPDLNGNNLVFGVRQQCINPTILNSKRESLGYIPDRNSMFNQDKPDRFRR